MADEIIRYKLEFDDSGIERALQNTAKSSRETQNVLKRIGDASKKALVETKQFFVDLGEGVNQAISEIKDYEKELIDVERALKIQQQVTANLRRELTALEKKYERAKSVNDAVGAERLSAQISALIVNLKESLDITEELTEEKEELAEILRVSEVRSKQFSLAIVGLLNNIRIGNQGLGNIIQSIFSYSKAITGANRATIGFVSVLRLLGLTFGAVVAAVLLLVALPLLLFFTRTKEGADILEVSLAKLRSQFDVLANRAAGFGKAIFFAFTNPAQSAIELSRSLNGIGKALSDARTNAEQFTKDLQALRDASAEFIINQAQLERQIQSQRQLADDSTRSTAQRIAALQAAGKLEAQIETERLRQAQENFRIVQRQNVQKNGVLIVNKELAEAEAAVERERAKAEQRKFQDLQALRALREESRQSAETERKAIEQLNAVLQQLNSKINALRLEELAPRERIQRELELALEEIDRFETETRKAFAERKKQFNLEREFDDLRQLTRRRAEKELTDLTLKELSEQLRISNKAADERRENEEAFLQRQLQQIDVLKQIELARAEQIKDAGKTEVELVREKERLRLEIEQRALQQRLLIIEQLRGADSFDAQLLREQIKVLQQQIDKVDSLDLSVFDRLKDKLLKSLGITEREAQLIAQQLEKAFGNLAAGLDAITEKQIANQDRILKAIQQRISETEKLLAEEERRQEQGEANNANRLRAALAQQQAERERAEKKRAELEQQAARRRLAINAAEQISEYALAVTKLARANAGFGLPGIALTVAGIALLFRLIKQAQAINFETPGFREGTSYVDGRGTTTSDMIRSNLSVGERVVSSDLNDMVGGRSVSNADLVKYYLIGRQVASSRADSLAKVLPTVRKTDQQLRASQSGFEYGIMADAYKSAAMNAANTMINYWKSRPIEYIDGNGDKVIRWTEGGTQRIQKIKL